MKTQYYTATSLDGFIADSHNSLDWLFQFGEVAGDSYANFIREVGAIAMGSTTYEWILAHHINKDADRPQAWMYEQPTWVFSSRVLPKIEGADIRFVKGDVRQLHQEMITAAGDLVGQFYDRGLLDEIIVSIASVTLGSGAPLLPRAIATPPLKLLTAKIYGDCFVELHYEVRYASES
jgi:dihydrofolate reductase